MTLASLTRNVRKPLRKFFPLLSILLPSSLRPAVEAIYCLCAQRDDLADEGDASAEERLRALGAYEASAGQNRTKPGSRFHAISKSRPGNKRIPVADPALPRFAVRFQTRRHHHPISTNDLLMDYCRRSANPWKADAGLIWRKHGGKPARLGRNMLGLQLINFWQDVAIDLQSTAYICRRKT